MNLVLLLAGLAATAAADPEIDADPAPASAETPPPPASAEPEPERLVVTCEALGQGDDRTARRVEDQLRAQEATLMACRTDAVAQGADPARYTQIELKLRGDGRVRKAVVVTPTGVAHTDACVMERALAVELTPPPMFADKLQLNVTWALPSAEE